MNTSAHGFPHSFSAFAAVLSMCLIPVLVHAQTKPKWEEFRSYEGRFRVLSPGDMRSKTDTIETAIGKLAYHSFFFEDAEQSTETMFTQNATWVTSEPASKENILPTSRKKGAPGG